MKPASQRKRAGRKVAPLTAVRGVYTLDAAIAEWEELQAEKHSDYEVLNAAVALAEQLAARFRHGVRLAGREKRTGKERRALAQIVQMSKALLREFRKARALPRGVQAADVASMYEFVIDLLRKLARAVLRERDKGGRVAPRNSRTLADRVMSAYQPAASVFSADIDFENASPRDVSYASYADVVKVCRALDVHRLRRDLLSWLTDVVLDENRAGKLDYASKARKLTALLYQPDLTPNSVRDAVTAARRSSR